ncbi:MAG: protoporphyrinogen oxidase [Bacteroidales bacterium]
MQNDADVIVLGAGLTGLVVAHKLKQQGKKVYIIEKKSRVGGVIDTEERNGFVFEKGPNTGIIKYGEVAKLFEELGNLCHLEIPSEEVKKRYIWKGERWHQLPSGIIEGIRTPLFKWKDKLRLLGEPFRKPGNNPCETLDQLVKRRMGQSFLNYAVDPFILGVYAGDPARIVPKYALPKLYYLEQDYGSFIGGAIKKRLREEKDEMEKQATKEVFSVKGGLKNLVQALAKSIDNESFILNAKDTTVEPIESSRYRILVKDGSGKKEMTASTIISTIPSHEVPQVFNFIEDKLLENINNLLYAKVIQVALGFNNWHGIPLDGFGGLVPYVEKRDILGALYISSLLANRAPEKGGLLSVFMGGIRREEMYDKTDKEIEQVLSNEIPTMFGLANFYPDLMHIMRYKYAIPQYERNTKERYEAIKKAEHKYKGIILAGNMRDGIGMADRIKQAWDISKGLRS